MKQEELQKLYANLFEWLTREVVVGIFLGIAAALLLLGLVYVFARPRAIGLLVATLGLWLLPHAWIWYFAPSMKSGSEIAFLILAISMAMVNAFILWSSTKPTAHETGQPKPLRVVGAGTFTLFAYHAVQYAAVLTLANPPQHAWYYWRFAPPVLLLLGAAFVAAGMVYAFIKRARTTAPPRPFQPL